MFVIKDMEESGTVDDYQTEFEQKIGGHKYVVWLTVFHCPQADELAITDITTRSENEHAVPPDAYLRSV